jgi:hypothetical protein
MASSGPQLDLDFLTKRKDNVEVPQGIDTPMCFCGDSCKLVRCKVLGGGGKTDSLNDSPPRQQRQILFEFNLNGTNKEINVMGVHTSIILTFT